ncbi:DNA repair protein RadA [Rubeoparvulum massiliense]|uniref:DNA repair protein RadA n=1 Tax=Rubeoparvulum massiliense TaxID=1631346 RepID=UPI00065DE0A9|nr:DNA repair protein RadA [Rubeoparvulum massiliense]
MAKIKTKFICQDCGYESPKWMGRCPGCNEWNTLHEEIEDHVPAWGNRHASRSASSVEPQPITQIQHEEELRYDTHMVEFNRVLGGGIVPGSLVLVGGDPGIGKSTILLQLSNQLATQGFNVLYVSGEESVKQISLRAKRLQIGAPTLYMLPETNLLEIIGQVEKMSPQILVIDSIQTIFHPEVTSAPGSVSQVRECTSILMRLAKQQGIATFIVGHVTKQGDIAGPRLLEHMVDTVLYFEGERHHTYRILRAVKNRFGSTNELGIYEMREEGLLEVQNPSKLFLSERPVGVAGSTVVASIEGTRPLLVEIQALLSPTAYGSPRRMTTGVDSQRVAMLMAVLEKRVGMMLGNQDAFVNVAGGVRLDEPAIDLAILIALASTFRNQPTQPNDVVVGEVGLTGEVRAVSRIEQRVHEAKKLGFKRIIIPVNNLQGWTPPKDIVVQGVSTVQEALEVVLGR